MKIELIGTESPYRRIVIDKLPAVVGRAASAEVCLNDSFVGSYQCIIEQGDEGIVVWDLGTRTGTFVNGVRIRRGPLMPGDTLTVGRTDFIVQYEFAVVMQ
jgi:pSer/pThr/pTyr-binding forkhead associated (FHA) protein